MGVHFDDGAVCYLERYIRHSVRTRQASSPGHLKTLTALHQARTRYLEDYERSTRSEIKGDALGTHIFIVHVGNLLCLALAGITTLVDPLPGMIRDQHPRCHGRHAI